MLDISPLSFASLSVVAVTSLRGRGADGYMYVTRLSFSKA